MFYETKEARARSWILEAISCEERSLFVMAEVCRQIAEEILSS